MKAIICASPMEVMHHLMTRVCHHCTALSHKQVLMYCMLMVQSGDMLPSGAAC